MTLAALIRKRTTGNLANANPANSANDGQEKGQPLARLATLALANPPEGKADIDRLADEDESAIRRWLAHIEETDPAIIAQVFEQCRADADARAWFIAQAGELNREQPKREVLQ